MDFNMGIFLVTIAPGKVGFDISHEYSMNCNLADTVDMKQDVLHISNYKHITKYIASGT